MNALNDLTFKDKYLDRPGLDALHQEIKEWLSDIAFWNDEIDFFKILINHNFVYLLVNEDLAIVEQIAREMAKLKANDLKKLQKLVHLHEMKLAEMIKSPYVQEEEYYRRWHRHLENKVREMTLQIRELKEQLFWAVQEVLKADVVKHLSM